MSWRSGNGWARPSGRTTASSARLFNASLDGNVRRAIDLAEGDDIDAVAFKDLIRAAAALNADAKRSKAKRT